MKTLLLDLVKNINTQLESLNQMASTNDAGAFELTCAVERQANTLDALKRMTLAELHNTSEEEPVSNF